MGATPYDSHSTHRRGGGGGEGRAGLELSKQTEGELAKRNHVYQKTIKTLLAKLKQQDVTMRDEEEELSRQVVHPVTHLIPRT